MERDYSRREVLDIIEREAGRSGIPRDDFLRFAYIETGGRFDEHASRGPGGAKGLFQFVPGTAAQYGIAGREFDAVENTRAAARLYLDNRDALVGRHARDDRPFLSGEREPGGLDMYLAHQQGAGGYRSLQTAIATGQFGLPGTRANLINNVSARDIEAVTGHTHARFKAMSDREMAATFVEYWDAKFDRVRIPEKGIEAVAAAPAPPRQEARIEGIALTAAHAMSLSYDHVQYGFGIKDPDSGRVDCSGWVVAMQNATMDEINGKAGRSVFGREDRFSPGFDSAAAIVQKSHARSGVLLEGGQVTLGALHEGMVIGEDNGAKSWDRGRFKGIDHIVMVVRDPASGELMVSQSRGGEGVELRTLDGYLSSRQARGVKLYASDPLPEARELLHGQGRDDRGDTRSARPAAGPVSARLLEDGSRGEDVRRLQEGLRELGYEGLNGRALALDSDFGRNTGHAVRAFQRDRGLEVDGIAGPLTMSALGKQLDVARTPAASAPASPAVVAATATPVERLESILSGQVHPAAHEAWSRNVSVLRQSEPAVPEQDASQQQRQAEQAR